MAPQPASADDENRYFTEKHLADIAQGKDENPFFDDEPEEDWLADRWRAAQQGLGDGWQATQDGVANGWKATQEGVGKWSREVVEQAKSVDLKQGAVDSWKGMGKTFQGAVDGPASPVRALGLNTEKIHKGWKTAGELGKDVIALPANTLQNLKEGLKDPDLEGIPKMTVDGMNSGIRAVRITHITKLPDNAFHSHKKYMCHNWQEVEAAAPAAEEADPSELTV